MSKRTIITTSVIALAAMSGIAFAQGNGFKTHFMSEWDANSDGKITLEEVTTRRGDVFTSFDANEDGFMDIEEQGMMDEMRQTQHGEMGAGGGMGQGKGKGMGMGQGKGMGKGMGRMQQAAEGGMHNGKMIDTDGDGKFSRDEFVGMSERWLARMDGNSDGVITDADF